jgi:hypothetical protein
MRVAVAAEPVNLVLLLREAAPTQQKDHDATMESGAD